jgi:hypothetical protein
MYIGAVCDTYDQQAEIYIQIVTRAIQALVSVTEPINLTPSENYGELA